MLVIFALLLVQNYLVISEIFAEATSDVSETKAFYLCYNVRL